MIKIIVAVFLAILMITIGGVALQEQVKVHESWLKIICLVLAWCVTVPAFLWWLDFFKKHLK